VHADGCVGKQQFFTFGVRVSVRGTEVERTPVRLLLVDDHEAWRHHIRAILEHESGLRVVGEASDGLDAVQSARELQPDLVCLDIGFPGQNGLEAAKQIQKVFPNSKILFVSENRSSDIAEAALRTGASGYVLKSNAGSALLPTLRAALRDRESLRANAARDVSDPTLEHNGDQGSDEELVGSTPVENRNIVHHHAVGLYSDDRHFLEDATLFVAIALNAGNSVIVVASESHRKGIFSGFRSQALDIDAVIEQGRYIAIDAARALSELMANGLPDPVRFMQAFGDLILSAAKASKGEGARVAVCGEGVNLLWAQGNLEAAIRIAELCNQLTDLYNVDIWCGYSLGSVPLPIGKQIFERICSEHSAVCYR
jgi:DNA-binding NarL/FixJ family response regulator